MTLPTYGPHNAPNKFYTAKGQLTRYGLACGYVEKRNTHLGDGDVTTDMYHEGGCYHIRTNGPGIGYYDRYGIHVDPWDSADTLTEARKLYAKHIKEYHRG